MFATGTAGPRLSYAWVAAPAGRPWDGTLFVTVETGSRARRCATDAYGVEQVAGGRFLLLRERRAGDLDTAAGRAAAARAGGALPDALAGFPEYAQR